MPRILLVEDDPVAQELVKAVLETLNWNVDVADDGFASLRLLQEHSYDVALIDYHLPEMDGYALARLMRDVCSARNETLPLIGMTADQHGLASRRGVDGVFDQILAKPFPPTELIALLKKIIPDICKPQDMADAAAALLAEPGLDRASNVAETIWREQGLSGFPKACLLPQPTPDQIAAVGMCFDVVEQADAELVLVLDARGLQELIRKRLGASLDLPAVALDQALAIVTDAYFSVADLSTWSKVAALLHREKSRGAMGHPTEEEIMKHLRKHASSAAR